MILSISQWNRWKIEIMFWENDTKPRISQWNLWKIEIMSEINYLRIMSICQYEMVAIQKSRFMTVFIWIFIKKDFKIEFKMVLFRDSPVLYHIDDTKISYHILSVSCTKFAILPMPVSDWLVACAIKIFR